MNKSNKFSPEVRERAVRMVLEHRGEYPSPRVADISPLRHVAVPDLGIRLSSAS